MQNLLKSNEWPRLLIRKTFKFEIQKDLPNNSGSLQKLFFKKWGPRSEFVEISKVSERYSWIEQNALKCNEWQSIFVLKTFKIDIKKGVPNHSDFLQNWFLSEVKSPFLICRNLKTLRKVHLEREKYT